jgi:hypothetical protein
MATGATPTAPRLIESPRRWAVLKGAFDREHAKNQHERPDHFAKQMDGA